MLRTFTPLLLHFANPLLYTNRIIAIICDRNNRNEQARILFQMALSFESREELDTHAMFQSLVEQAAKFTPRMLYFFGFALMGIIQIKPLSFTHLLTLGPKSIIDPG
jgi:hypothetical protein